jgi:RNA polymerase sigma-70 factor (ECF subfamily)
MKRSEIDAELGRHHSDSFGWALACCRWDRTEAEDVLQLAYLKILDGRAKFGGRSSFRTWLYAVIRRTAVERRRRERVRRLALLRWLERAPEPAPPDLDGQLHRSSRARELARALARLTERQRSVLHLVFYEDVPIREAAEVLGISLGSARTHYERGKRRLRELLGDGGRNDA